LVVDNFLLGSSFPEIQTRADRRQDDLSSNVRLTSRNPMTKKLWQIKPEISAGRLVSVPLQETMPILARFSKCRDS
jgi:hypothetical protein